MRQWRVALSAMKERRSWGASCGIVCCVLMGSTPTIMAGAATMRTGAQQPAAWAAAWPMVGHDPRRTNRGTGSGPLRPHLVFGTRGIVGLPLIGPDGNLYGWGQHGVVALRPDGHPLWIARLTPGEGSQPALTPTGQLVVNGMDLAAPQGPALVVQAVAAPTGRPIWTLRTLPWTRQMGGAIAIGGRMVPMGPSLPNSKGAAPLVEANGTIFMPFLGPSRPNTGMEMIAPNGRPLRQLAPGFPPQSLAQAADGSVYAVGGDGTLALAAVRLDGSLRWQRSLGFRPGALTGILVGRSGTIYATDGESSRAANGEVVAYAPTGRLLWRVTDAGTGTLAERADGSLLVASDRRLTALSPAGAELWRRSLGHQATAPHSLPTVAVDGRGHAFVGTAEGLIYALDRDGSVLWTTRVGPSGFVSAACVLGPAGQLVVIGTDGILRAYRP
ncbi:MAG: hypothetical protein NVSMB65_09530 [Chloroflexota bacterium]